MRILCTGATGFIGTNVVLALLDEKYEIAILKRKTSELKYLESYKSHITVYDYSDYSDIYTGIEEYKPDLIIHLATFSIYTHTQNNIQSLLDSNVCFGMHILEAMKRSGVSKILNFGTRWQHINNELYNPANLYAATKQAFYDILRWYNKDGIMSKTLELCDTFGKQDIRSKIVSLLIDAYKKKIPVELSKGEQILDILCVDNLVQYLILNIKNDRFYDNTVEQIVGQEIKLKDLGMLIEKLYNVKGLFLWGAKDYRINEVMTPPLCASIPQHHIYGDLESELAAYQ